ncbi:hypothetical protein F5X96DRAFT_97102 [Biscogniauxia mediterranea]|nr:hypothetical protein F5X96DRAFT_97102 [Biscogniauxia mediterranea]
MYVVYTRARVCVLIGLFFLFFFAQLYSHIVFYYLPASAHITGVSCAHSQPFISPHLHLFEEKETPLLDHEREGEKTYAPDKFFEHHENLSKVR